jgi:hypothetical protein
MCIIYDITLKNPIIYTLSHILHQPYFLLYKLRLRWQAKIMIQKNISKDFV